MKIGNVGSPRLWYAIFILALFGLMSLVIFIFAGIIWASHHIKII